MEGDWKENNMENDNFVLDLSGVDEKKTGGFECLPKGEYEAIVDDCEFGESQRSGAPMITWKFKVIHEEYQNRVLFFHTVLNKDFGIAMLKKTILSLGAEVDMASFNPGEFADSGEAIGLPIRLKVGIQKYEGEKRNNVKDVMPSDGGDGFFG